VILAAGLLVLLGLGLFVAGIVTGMTVLYWGCVAACVVAAVLLVVVRRQTGPATRTPKAGQPAAEAPKPETTRAPAASAGAEPGGAAPAAEAAAAAQEPETVAGDAPEGGAPPAAEAPDPGVEEVEVTDLLLVVDLTDEVLVVDEHPRYHVAECTWLAGRETIPLPLDEARTDGFTPCAVCSPDRTLAERARAARQSGS
jgi:hypothetical protein